MNSGGKYLGGAARPDIIHRAAAGGARLPALRAEARYLSLSLSATNDAKEDRPRASCWLPHWAQGVLLPWASGEIRRTKAEEHESGTRFLHV